MRRLIRWCVASVALVVMHNVAVMCNVVDAQSSGLPQLPTPPRFLDQYRQEAVSRWEEAIVQLEKKDQHETDSPDSILFIGSSSIRLWETIAEDMAPFRPIQRGYGGARYSDLAVFASRLIRPHSYRALVIFVANDIRGDEGDFTPDEVEPLVRYVIEISRRHQPKAPVLLIEVTPTSSRFNAWDRIRRLNARLREVALTTPHAYFIATAERYLTPQGRPRDALFLEDRLHLNRDGYRLWGATIRQQLDSVLRLEAQAP